MATGSFEHDSNWAKVKSEETAEAKSLMREYDTAFRRSERTRSKDGEYYIKFESPSDTFHMYDEEHGECQVEFFEKLAPLLDEELKIKNISKGGRGGLEVHVFRISPTDGVEMFEV